MYIIDMISTDSWKNDLLSGVGEWAGVLDIPALHDVMDSIQLIGFDKVYPAAADIFRAFRECPFDKFKVLLIGQDPYHDGSADGLAFSSRGTSLPRSVRLIYDCMETCGLSPARVNPSPDLTHWAAQGVLLLNTALTVVKGAPKSMTKLWRGYMEILFSRLRPVVTIALGEEAKKIVTRMGNAAGSAYFWRHPSPMVATNRDVASPLHFSKCTCFTACNEYLISKGHAAIDWQFLEIVGQGPAQAPVKEDLTDPDVVFGETKVYNEPAMSVSEISNVMAGLLDKFEPCCEVVLEVDASAGCIDPGDADKKIHYLFSDGAAKGNGKNICLSGMAVVFAKCENVARQGPKVVKTYSVSVVYTSPKDGVKPTNNRAEMWALAVALKKAATIHGEENDGVKVISDSKYALNTAAVWYTSWVEKGVLAEKMNVDLAEILNSARVAVNEGRGCLSLLHIRGHTKFTPAMAAQVEARRFLTEEALMLYGNYLADIYAVKGVSE